MKIESEEGVRLGKRERRKRDKVNPDCTMYIHVCVLINFVPEHVSVLVVSSIGCILGAQYLDESSGHPVILHVFSGGGSTIDHKWFQLPCPHQLDGLHIDMVQVQWYVCMHTPHQLSKEWSVLTAHLWYETEEAGFAGIDDATYRVDAGAVVVTVEETVLHKLVVLNVPLHALSRHKVVLLLFHLPWLCWT